MAKDKITEYDATASNNTVCGDVNIAENSALPSDMNNFAREIMSHLKEGLGSGTPLYVDQTNNRLGINISSPSVPLHLKDGNPRIRLEDSDASSHSEIQSNGQGDLILKADPDNNGSSTQISFETDGSERMRIDTSGNLLVGTTSTTIDTSNYGHFIASNGQYKHARNANSTQYVTRVFGNAGNFNIAGDGDATNTNNSYAGISDRTLKENIENANSQWDDIKAIEIKNYNLIEYPNKRYLGVIAQDLEETGMSSLVKTDEDGIKSVKYSILYMKAVKALQEAMTRIETLETANTALEARITALETA